MNMVRYCIAVALILALGSSFTFGGGYQLNEHGTKAMAMGGAFAAQASDGSAMFFNPAGLAFQKGLRVMVGVTPIFPTNTFSSPTVAEVKMVKQSFFLPHAYGSYSLDNGITFGLGFNAPYGLGTEWPSTWAGRYLAVKTDLKSYHINPTLAYKISDRFAIGAGFTYVFSDVKLSRKIALALPTRPPTILPDGSITLDAKGHGVSFDVGILTKASDELSVGVSYRHSTKIEYDGTASFTDMSALSSLFPGGTGKTTLRFPNNAFAGIAYQITPKLTLEVDLQYIEWSTYDTLKIEIPVGPSAGPPLNRPLQGPSASPKNWDNTYMIRVGGQYQLDKLALRAGFVFDKTPQPNSVVEPLLPDASRNEITAGFGYELSPEFTVDVAYQVIFFRNRTLSAAENSFPGTYTSTAHLFGLSLGYNF